MVSLEKPLIINLAPTGAVADADKNTNVPVTAARIVEDVRVCALAGATIAHLHVRDTLGAPSCDPQLFAEVISGIRAHPETRGLVLCATTSGRHGQTPSQRAAVLELESDLRPEMASLTLGSLNFPKGVSINEPDTIRFLATRMREAGVKPELEVFDLGMIEFAKTLADEGLLSPPHYFNLILGNIGSLNSSIQHLAFALTLLPEQSIVSVGGIGRSQADAVALGIAGGFGIRIGLEDNLWADWTTRSPATNPGLVSYAARVSAALGRPLADVRHTRNILGLTGRAG